jgi:hypothetical protein
MRLLHQQQLPPLDPASGTNACAQPCATQLACKRQGTISKACRATVIRIVQSVDKQKEVKVDNAAGQHTRNLCCGRIASTNSCQQSLSPTAAQ